MCRPNPSMERGEGGIFSKASDRKLLFLFNMKIKKKKQTAQIRNDTYNV